MSLGDVRDTRHTHGTEHERLTAGRVTQRPNRIIDPEDAPLCILGTVSRHGPGENQLMAGAVAG
jgi:hypothetical protein